MQRFCSYFQLTNQSTCCCWHAETDRSLNLHSLTSSSSSWASPHRPMLQQGCQQQCPPLPAHTSEVVSDTSMTFSTAEHADTALAGSLKSCEQNGCSADSCADSCACGNRTDTERFFFFFLGLSCTGSGSAISTSPSSIASAPPASLNCSIASAITVAFFRGATPSS